MFKETEYENYFVSKCGKIISIKIKGGNGRTDITKPHYPKLKIDKDGYLEMCISKMIDGVHKRIYRRLHRLVYETWVGKIKDTINHIDRNKQNNHIDNLEDMSREENSRINHYRNRTYKITIETIGTVIFKCNYVQDICKFVPINRNNLWQFVNKGRKYLYTIDKYVTIKEIK